MDFPLVFGTPWPWWLVALAAGGAGALSWQGYRKRAGELPAPRLMLVNSLRWGAWGLLFLCLMQPMRRMHIPEERASRVTVLVDDSESMSFSDKPNGPSRMERVKAALGTGEKGGTDGLLGKLGNSFNFQLEGFHNGSRPVNTLKELNAEGGRTDITKALNDAYSRLKGPDAGGLILVSDGNDTGKGDLKQAAQQFRRSGIPIYAIGIGALNLPDLAVTQVRCHREVSKDTLARVEVDFSRNGIPPGPVTIKITRNNQVVKSTQVELTKETGTALFEFLPPEQGFLEYEAVIEPAPGELITSNNTLPFGFMSFSRKLKVLYMEGSIYQHGSYGRRTWPYKWEHEFLKEALEEDREVEVDILLKQDHPQFEGVLKSVRAGYPKKKKELYQYDVIVNSDIPYNYFSDEQVKNTIDFVGKHGGGFCMIGGWDSFGEGGYAKTEFDRMLPVEMEPGDTHDNESYFRWKVTPVGQKHPIMQMDKDPEKNRKIWEMLNSLDSDRLGDARPGFHGFNKTKRAKPVASTLAVIADEELEGLNGPMTLVAVQPYGSGKSMAFTTDSTGGWGAAWEDAWGDNPNDPDRRNIYYKTFWKNAIRWLAEYRMRAPNQLVQVDLEKLVYNRGENPSVRIKVLNEDYEPTHEAAVTLSLTGPDGVKQELKAFPDYSSPGFYQRVLELNAVGRYELEAQAILKADVLGKDKALLQIRPSSEEARHLGQDEDTLRKIAKESGGEYLPIDQIEQLAKLLRQDTHVIQRFRDEDLWDRGWMFVLIVGMLCTEWYFRKKGGLP